MRLPEGAIFLVLLVSLAVVVWPAARICRKAGFSPWLGILSVVPLLNFALLWFVAFASWPSDQGRAGSAKSM